MDGPHKRKFVRDNPWISLIYCDAFNVCPVSFIDAVAECCDWGTDRQGGLVFIPHPVSTAIHVSYEDYVKCSIRKNTQPRRPIKSAINNSELFITAC